jgi:regulator of protease activity HflC (stomatin/prohibitin superfamily)
MKTIAARFDDPLFELLSLVADLEDTSIVDQIRQAVEAHIARKVQEGDLASRAEAAAAEIDREAEAKKAAIAGLIGAVNQSVGKQPAKKAATRRRTKADPNEGQGKLEVVPNPPIGFAPPRGKGR